MNKETRQAKIAAARKRREAQGLPPWGRPRVVKGEVLAKARAMRAEGRTLREIARAIGVGLASVHRALH